MEFKRCIIEHLLRFFNQSKNLEKPEILRCLPKHLRKTDKVKRAFDELKREEIIKPIRFKNRIIFRLNPKKIRELRKML